VGTSEFYGEIWKAMLRTNRTRLSAIKFLEKRIPRDLDSARDLMKKEQIYVSRYKIKMVPHKTKEGAVETRVVLEKDPSREEIERQHLQLNSLEDFFYFFYPMKDKLCLNSLLAGLADQSIYVNRGVVDFLISHAPITGRINKDLENVKLVEGALITLNRKDFAFIKKFFTWVLGHLDDDDDYKPKDSDPAIKTLVPALKCLYKKFMDKAELTKYQPKDK
jgi:Dopey, N-terminal